MLQKLHAFFGGTNPITGYLGSAIMVLDMAKQTFIDAGVPSDGTGWFAFVTTFLSGLALRFAKDGNKTNAPIPGPTHPIA